MSTPPNKMTEHTHTPGEMRVSGHTIYILNEDGTNRISANIQAGYIRQPRNAVGEQAPASHAEAVATAERLTLCWNCHDELVAALEEVLGSGLLRGSYQIHDRVREVVLAALAKARGEGVGL